MRQILVDHARRQRADKRGGGVTVLSLHEALLAARTSSVDVLALNEALDALSTIDPRRCRVVELRFFAGLTIDESRPVLPDFLISTCISLASPVNRTCFQGTIRIMPGSAN
jgi:hypothetical protein